ncbi:MAG TPA: hypothetical protein VM580_05870 [Labilithrix sp.]|nr:hypothetical protein [Labilithrix sp.]
MTRGTERASEYFQGLRDVLAAEEVRMSGAWSEKAQRRHATRDQNGTGEGPSAVKVALRLRHTHLRGRAYMGATYGPGFVAQ